MTPSQATRLTNQRGFFRYSMPYAYVALPHPTLRHVYLPVNRRYKPLGVTSLAHVNYADFLPQAVTFKSDPKKFDDIWVSKTAHLYLYNGDLQTLTTYFERLGRLMLKKPELLAAREANDWPPRK